MKFSRQDVATVIAQRSLGVTLKKSQITSLAAFLLQTGRTNELPSLLRDVRALWAEHGVLEVVLTSARPLPLRVITDARRLAHAWQPQAKRIVITPVIDPQLVGGAKLTVLGQQLDLSVEGKLKHFRSAALARSSEANHG